MTNEAKDQMPEWARTAAAKIADEAIELHTDQEIEGLSQEIARALLSAERRGIERALPMAQQLEKAIARAEEGAGTLPAREAVKLRPTDWHGVAGLARELATAIRRLGEAE